MEHHQGRTMTNPIPGADSERATFEAYAFNRWHYQVSRDERGHYHYKTVQLMWDVWQTSRTDAMVDAKVGANVAAPLSKDAIREIFMAHGFTIKAGETDWKQYVFDAAAALLAAGAPAETPKPVIADEQIDQTFKRLADTILQATTNEVRNEALRGIAALIDRAAQPSPAPIAGDVEKDAARYRWLVEKFGQTQLPCFLEDKLSHGYIADGKTSIDTAIDAAMLANSSSGEAG